MERRQHMLPSYTVLAIIPALQHQDLTMLNIWGLTTYIFHEPRHLGELYLLMLITSSCVRLTDNPILTLSRSPVSMLYIHFWTYTQPHLAIHLSPSEEALTGSPKRVKGLGSLIRYVILVVSFPISPCCGSMVNKLVTLIISY